MLNRLRRRYLEKKCKNEMQLLHESIDEMALNIAHENDISDFEAREFVIYSMMQNPSYRVAASHYINEVVSYG